MKSDLNLDNLFAPIAERAGNIDDLLNTFFGFLHRRTDFYTIYDAKRPSMGFKPGEAENKVLQAFRKHSIEKQQPKQKMQPPAAKKSSTSVKMAPSGKQVPVENGGTTSKYRWSQSLSDVTITIDLPECTIKKDITCEMKSEYLSFHVKPDICIEGKLQGKIRPDDSYWSLESNRVVTISLDKIVETWWGAPLEGDPEIDTGMVNSAKRIHEYDDSTQGTLRKIMFDQEQKRNGLPTSDELRSQKLLQEAKYLPGSPFLP